MATQMGSESRKRERGMNGGSSADTTNTTSTGNAGAQGDRLQEAATGLADQAGRTVEAQASTLMTKAGESLVQVARVIRDAGNNIRQERPEMATYADTTAQRVEDAATYLRDHDAREIVDTAQDFARRQPAIVVAGGLAAGLLVGRFLRSGDRQQSQSRTSATGQSGTRDYAAMSDTTLDTATTSTGASTRRAKARAGN